jgi:hypothetical protein
MEKLRSLLSSRGWEAFDVAYARYAFKGRDCNVTAYESGKLVVAGKGTEEFVTMTLEPEVTQAPKLGYDEVLHPDWFEPHAGLDESGKGDFFGPVVAATVIADQAGDRGMDQGGGEGLQEDRRHADRQAGQADPRTPRGGGRHLPLRHAEVQRAHVPPPANLNRLLAWQHATALAQALGGSRCAWGLLDQFSKQPLDPARAGEEGRPGLRAEDAHQGGGGPGRRRGLRRGPGRVRPPDARALEAVRRQAAERGRAAGQGAGGRDHRAIRRPRSATSPSCISAPPTRSWPPRESWTSCPCRNPGAKMEWGG